LGERPLVVLTAAAPVQTTDGRWATSEQGQRLRAVWFSCTTRTSWSARGRQVRLDDSHHYIQFERPDAVIDAVREVVADIRGHS
jgi:hypothetical protein